MNDVGCRGKLFGGRAHSTVGKEAKAFREF